MKALRLHGGGAVLARISRRVGRLADASIAMLGGREVDMLVSPSASGWTGAGDGCGCGDSCRGLGDGLGQLGDRLRRRDRFILPAGLVGRVRRKSRRQRSAGKPGPPSFGGNHKTADSQTRRHSMQDAVSRRDCRGVEKARPDVAP